ncbi:MAG: hypothetical protein IKP00_15285 [Victivallales bacterium]|nr:hypothetical protein [Victivallales bacterium]
MVHIIFVCESNRIASKMAAAYLAGKLKSLGATEFDVQSAGLRVRKGDGMPPAAQQVITELGYDCGWLGAKPLDLKDVRASDLIVCLSAAVLKKVSDSFFSARGKLIHIMTQLPNRPETLRDVFEPRSNLESCKNCLAMMRPALDNMAEKLKE